MTIATSAGIKDRCTIASDDTSADTKIAAAVAYADGYIAALASSKGISVPSSTAALTNGADDIGAYYMLRTTAPQIAEAFRIAGELLIQACMTSAAVAESSGGGASIASPTQLADGYTSGV